VDLGEIRRLPQFQDVDFSLDRDISFDEFMLALRQMKNCKAPGEDGVPADIWKYGGVRVQQELFNIICRVWSDGQVPLCWRGATICMLFKKGDRSICDNYRGISLLVVAGKIFSRILANRIYGHCDQVLPEAQCGFRQGRSTTDMIFSFRQLQEKAAEHHVGLYAVFLDLTQAYDLTNRDGMFTVLSKVGLPPKVLELIAEMHKGTHASVRVDGKLSEQFEITNGVRQGCVLAPLLFIVFLAGVLRHAFETCVDEDLLDAVYIRSRKGVMFASARLLKSCPDRVNQLVRDFLFADDLALVAHTEAALQQFVSQFSDSCRVFGLVISIKKSEVMVQAPPKALPPLPAKPQIRIGDSVLKVVPKFTYLGSVISDNLSLDAEIANRIRKAAGIFVGLFDRVFGRPQLRVQTKVNMYNATVLPTLLYGC
jgi:hypothetical protein